MKLSQYCTIILALLLFACGGEKPSEEKVAPKDPFETALPHGSSLPAEKLSNADRHKLAAAKGRTVDTLALDQFNWMIDSLGGKLNILSFWSLDCITCASTNKQLSQISNTLGDSLLQLTFINVDDLEYKPQVDAGIREQGLVNETYILQQDSLLQWQSKVQHNWEGSLPAILLLNQEEGIRLFYQKAFTYEELMALVAPFTL